MAAPDKFRGTASAREIAAAIGRAAVLTGRDCAQVPLADGGEGTLDALGGANRECEVIGPLGKPVLAGWRLSDRTAVIEMALASGLVIAGGRDLNDAMAASTRGTGQLIAAALDAGARQVIVGVGGSATTDGGLGAVEVLRSYGPFGSPDRPEVVVACDVTTTFTQAARLFGPQKGATPEQVALLSERLLRLRAAYRDELGVDVEALAGSGAAGGLAGGLAALGAAIVPGFDVVSSRVGLRDAIAAADLVVTGEGSLDSQSFQGKVVGGVAAMAAELGVPVLTVVGATTLSQAPHGMDVIALESEYGRRSWTDTTDVVTEAVRDYLDSRR